MPDHSDNKNFWEMLGGMIDHQTPHEETQVQNLFMNKWLSVPEMLHSKSPAFSIINSNIKHQMR